MFFSYPFLLPSSLIRLTYNPLLFTSLVLFTYLIHLFYPPFFPSPLFFFSSPVLFSHSPLLSTSIIPLSGSYEAIQKVRIHEALLHLTGGSVQQVNLTQDTRLSEKGKNYS